jgi:hypothetical protein
MLSVFSELSVASISPLVSFLPVPVAAAGHVVGAGDEQQQQNSRGTVSSSLIQSTHSLPLLLVLPLPFVLGRPLLLL